MIPKALQAITKEDIYSLLANGVAESRTIEYKAKLQVGSDDEKREFLKDVSAFGNTIGGDLLFGVAEDKGIPTDIAGLASLNVDETQLRLEQIIRDGIEPRLEVQIRAVEGFSEGPVLLIRVSKSWTAPHMVTYKRYSRFFARNSAENYQMDVTELRNTFLMSQTIAERIREFRDSRLQLISSGETPVPVIRDGYLILHIVPLTAYTPGYHVPLSALAPPVGPTFAPIGASGWNHRINMDGLVTFSGDHLKEPSRSYCQIFRNGSVEAVYSGIVSRREQERFIAFTAYETRIVDAIQDYLGALEKLAVPGPMVAMLTYHKVGGAQVPISGHCDWETLQPLDRDTLLLPDFILNGNGDDVPATAKSAFDTAWNAVGLIGSRNYDESGKWSPRR